MKQLELTIDDLELSVRSTNALKSNYGIGGDLPPINTVADLIKLSSIDLRKRRHMGLKSLNEIREKLARLGLSLAGDVIISSEVGISICLELSSRLAEIRDEITKLKWKLDDVNKMIDSMTFEQKKKI